MPPVVALHERIGHRACPHVIDAMTAMELVTSNVKGRDPQESIDEVSAVIGPLHLAYNCLVTN